MPCEKYKAALIDAAASQEVNAILHAHLEKCASCHAAYDDERSLFAALDAEVSSLANAQATPSFPARLRAALERQEFNAPEGPPKPWFVWRPAMAVAGVCLALLLAIYFRAFRLGEPSAVAVATTEKPAGKVARAREDLSLPKAGSGAQKFLVASREAHFLISQAPKQSHGLPDAEVLVPSDERDALAHFVAQLPQRRDVAVALTRSASFTPPPAAAAEPLQIAQLKVASLVPEEAN